MEQSSSATYPGGQNTDQMGGLSWGHLLSNPFAILYHGAPSTMIYMSNVLKVASQWRSNSPTNLLWRPRFMCKLFDLDVLAVFFHAPQYIPINYVARKESIWTGIDGTYRRSLTPNPFAFIAIPEVFQNSPQSSIVNFFSHERPMAFKKSVGVLIFSAMWAMSVYELVRMLHEMGVPFGAGIRGGRIVPVVKQRRIKGEKGPMCWSHCEQNPKDIAVKLVKK